MLRAVSLVSIPIAALFDVLTLAQLYAVAVIVSIGTAFFDVAHMSFLPSIVAKEQLPKSMGTLESVRSLSVLFGPGFGGWRLVQVLTAPIAIVVDAVSYMISATLLATVKAKETPSGGRVSLMEGLRYVLGHPILRLVGLVGAMNMFISGIWGIVQPLYLINELGVSAAGYGLMISGAGAGGLLGALLASRVIARFGHGPTIWGTAVLMLPLFVLVAFTGPGWRLALYPIGMALVFLVGVMNNVAQGSYRQAICPEALRGRMNASLRFIMWGSLPLGGLVGGLLGEAITVHQLLWIATSAPWRPTYPSCWLPPYESSSSRTTAALWTPTPRRTAARRSSGVSTSGLTESMSSRHSSLAPPARCLALDSPPKRGVNGVPV